MLDPTGKNVANTRIVLTNVQTKARQAITSDAQGRFEFANLAPGTYEMEASLPGFKTLRGPVTVAAAGVTRDIKLQLGSLQETVVVSGATSGAARGTKSGALRPRREAPPCVPTAMGGNVQPPLKLTDVKPEYPEALRSAKVAGLVVDAQDGRHEAAVREFRAAIAIAPDDRTVWVANPDNNSVSLLEVRRDSNRKVAEVRVGERPTHVAISPDGKMIAYSSDRNGNYDVYVWNPGAVDYSMWVFSMVVPVDIVHAGTTSTVIVNEQINYAEWNYLGTYNFNAGTNGFVRVRTDGTGGDLVTADAVRFVK